MKGKEFQPRSRSLTASANGLEPWHKTQNQAKRFNKLDNQNCFWDQESILSIQLPGVDIGANLSPGSNADQEQPESCRSAVFYSWTSGLEKRALIVVLRL